MVLSTFGDAKHVGRSIRAGAKGYLLKDESSHALIEKIVALHNGASPISAPIAKILIQQLSESHKEPENHLARADAIARFQLGAREVDVLTQLALGLSIILIADRLHISPHTVNQHLRNIYRKLNINSKSELFNKFKV
jgi:DNA-binding NarL/FixJ family response regulator